MRPDLRLLWRLSKWEWLCQVLDERRLLLWAALFPRSFDRWFRNDFMAEYKRELEAKHKVKL